MLDRIVLKEHQMFLVSDGAGNLVARNTEGQGLYWNDTRVLSLFELQVGPAPLQLLSAASEHNFMTTLQFANQMFELANGQKVSARSLSIRRNRFLFGGLHERLGIFNYNPFPVPMRVTMALGSDFRDMFDIRGYAPRASHGTIERPVVDGQSIALAYAGLDGRRRETHIHFDCRPASIVVHEPDPEAETAAETLPGLSGSGDPRVDVPIVPPTATAIFDVVVPPGRYAAITTQITPSVAGTSPPLAQAPSLDAAFSAARASYRHWEESCTRIVTDDEIVNALLQRSLHDLRLLCDQIEDGYLPSAGIPWFSVPFGRDSLITSLQTLMLQPDIARGTLLFLAEHQGREVNDWRDEQPGKILHEIRLGELAALGQVPHTPYYGTVDATPLFLIALGEYVRWTGDRAFAERLRPHAEAALRWIDEYGDLDGDGYVEYVSRSARGIRNQGWKDSAASATHRDGRVAEPPVALAEVQGYVYGAWVAMADYFAWLGDPARAVGLRSQAADLRARFLHDWWVQSERFFGMALDREKRLVETVTSNIGHCLWTGLLDDAAGRVVGARLIGEDMLCGWGVRTLSSLASSFNPMSYHNGSVWPHDNSIVIAGLKRFRMDAEALRVADEVLDAAIRFPLYRLPELYCGFARDRRYFSMPAQYPVSCSPQSWAAGSVFLLLQSLLGLRVDVDAERVLLRPTLPNGVNRVTVENMRVGSQQIAFEVFRDGVATRVDVTRAAPLGVVVEPPVG
ncbi:MAG: amylo-alpha-1,6-glucosidase [Chloroflexi bacterium]|nr:amylo-alpha-1,6-glucosidase [Chloroflexota bacterium]